VGMFFLPHQPIAKQRCEEIIELVIAEEELQLFGWRIVSTDDSMLHVQAKETQAVIRQVFILSPYAAAEDIKFETKLYRVRRKIEKSLKDAGLGEKEQYYLVSFSARTIIYKGLLLSEQLKHYYSDLNNEEYESALIIVHNRFSTSNKSSN
jgi:glutamate synthase domain-containing protein 1